MSIRYAYLHGFASSPLATKAQALKRSFAARGLELHTPDLNAPSFATLSYTGMLEAFDRFDAALGGPPARWRLIGSSMGGFLAARWAELHPERVDRLILLCPAFDFVSRWPSLIGAANFERWQAEGSFLLPDATGKPIPVHFGLVEDARDNHPARPPVPCATTIIHGNQDVVVPLESSREYAAAHADRVRLVEVDDDHLLGRSLSTIEAVVFTELVEPTTTLWWDYFGPAAEGTAAHFRVHLDEFLAREQLAGCITGTEIVEVGRHAAAWCRTPEPLVEVIGRALRPRRVSGQPGANSIG